MIAAPPVAQAYQDWKQERLLSELDIVLAEPSAIAGDTRLISEYEQLADLFEHELNAEQAEAEDEAALPEQPDAPTAEEPIAAPAPEASAPAIAVIEIDKIKVKLPVLEGATQENMKYAAAHMKETAAIGEIGNAAIAAHRARKKGRLFNRLGELEAGDQIRVRTDEEELLYTVFRVSIVEPTDISVLGSNDQDRILTLITCDPVVNPTHRLIVHAKL